ncbi:NOP protein chaperone 1 [Vanacampus margaritifer]
MDNNNKTSSKDLLSCGSNGGLVEKLLLKPPAGLATERVPRSSVMERLQSFLPQIAEANQKLKQQIEESPAGHFNIEDVEGAEKVIEMDVALVELSGSDSSESEEDSSDSEDGEESEIILCERSLRLPGHKGKKENINIQVVEQSEK